MFLAVSVIVYLPGLRAESYQFEVSGSYYNQMGDRMDCSMYGMDATAYFEQVSVDGRPYMETAFIQKAGYVKLSGGFGEFEGEGLCEQYEYYGGYLKFIRKKHENFFNRPSVGSLYLVFRILMLFT